MKKESINVLATTHFFYFIFLFNVHLTGFNVCIYKKRSSKRNKKTRVQLKNGEGCVNIWFNCYIVFSFSWFSFILFGTLNYGEASIGNLSIKIFFTPNARANEACLKCFIGKDRFKNEKGCRKAVKIQIQSEIWILFAQILNFCRLHKKMHSRTQIISCQSQIFYCDSLMYCITLDFIHNLDEQSTNSSQKDTFMNRKKPLTNRGFSQYFRFFCLSYLEITRPKCGFET